MDGLNVRENTAACGIDCFNCEFFHANVQGFFETMEETRKAAFLAGGGHRGKIKLQRLQA